MKARLWLTHLSKNMNTPRVYVLFMFVLFAVLLQIVFHDAEVHYQSTDVQAHSCIFHQTDSDPTPPSITLVLLGVFKTYQPLQIYPLVFSSKRYFITPLLRAPPHIS